MNFFAGTQHPPLNSSHKNGAAFIFHFTEKKTETQNDQNLTIKKYRMNLRTGNQIHLTSEILLLRNLPPLEHRTHWQHRHWEAADDNHLRVSEQDSVHSWWTKGNNPPGPINITVIPPPKTSRTYLRETKRILNNSRLVISSLGLNQERFFFLKNQRILQVLSSSRKMAGDFSSCLRKTPSPTRLRPCIASEVMSLTPPWIISLSLLISFICRLNISRGSWLWWVSGTSFAYSTLRYQAVWLEMKTCTFSERHHHC